MNRSRFELQLARRLLKAFRDLVIINRFGAGLSGTGWSPIEAHIVLNLSRSPGQTASWLQAMTQYDQGALSRVVQRLIKEGSVRAEQNPEDKRSQKLYLSDKAMEAFTGGEGVYNARSTRAYSGLTPHQADTLYRGYEALAEAKRVPESVVWDSEHPSRTPVRRMTVAVGYLGNNFFGSKLSPNQFLILQTIADPVEFPNTPATVAKTLGIKRSLVSYTLNWARELDAVEMKPLEHDARSYEISLNDAGERLLDELAFHVMSHFERAEQVVPDFDPLQFVAAFEEFGRTAFLELGIGAENVGKVVDDTPDVREAGAPAAPTVTAAPATPLVEEVVVEKAVSQADVVGEKPPVETKSDVEPVVPSATGEVALYPFTLKCAESAGEYTSARAFVFKRVVELGALSDAPAAVAMPDRHVVVVAQLAGAVLGVAQFDRDSGDLEFSYLISELMDSPVADDLVREGRSLLNSTKAA